MGLNATIKDAATAIAPTGGSDITLSSLGIQSGINSLYPTADTTLQTRRRFDFSCKDAKANATSPGGMTQPRRKFVMTVPRVITVNGVSVQTQDKVTVDVSFDISATSSQIKNLRYLAAQALGDTDFDAFYEQGSLA